MKGAEELALWKRLASASDKQRAMVSDRVGEAAALLSRVIETFPTYTLHDATHAENVVHLMSQLLGTASEKLTPLEAAMLILAAYYHDIGMVFDLASRQDLTKEKSDWEAFLQNDADAFVAVAEKGEVTPEIAERYCRWRHADRVFVHLNGLPNSSLMWDSVCLREWLGQLCVSHNRDAVAVQTDDHLQVDFLTQADLRFCAILLRLADILDFDNSRSPEAVYKYLGLARRETARTQVSDVEWRKHLCSDGFEFPRKKRDGYELGFVAGPDHPAVEHDVRRFLETIEGELERCSGLLRTCSDKWRDFPLPGHISRHNIKSNGYRYGEYRFSLDQDQIINTLMGENIYENPYVFVRELLQNAMDTSRHREYLERGRGRADFKSDAIAVSDWFDADGYHWVRFDDFGVGMDESIIREHLLKVGCSFYTTARFKADLLRAMPGGAGGFLPISRFGIGLLSCFIVSDRVEISTLRQRADGTADEPVRLSLDGTSGFYTLQTPKLPPRPMPGPGGDEPDYRADFGTSVAVRLDPRKEMGPFGLRALLVRYVACPPVKVRYAGQDIGGDPAILVDKPWCERATTRLGAEEMARIQEVLCCRFSEPLELEVLPVDLTAHSETPELRGQILVLRLKFTQELKSFVDEFDRWGSLSASIEFRRGEGYRIKIEVNVRGWGPDEVDASQRFAKAIQQVIDRVSAVGDYEGPEQSEVTLESALPVIPAAAQSIVESVAAEPEGAHGEQPWLSHNGVVVPTRFPEDIGWFPHRLAVKKESVHGSDSWAVGLWAQLALSDTLRPDLAVSRESIRQIPWRIHWHANLALRRALLSSEPSMRRWELADILNDPLLRRGVSWTHLSDGDLRIVDGTWAKEPLIRVGRELKSLEEIRATLDERGELEISSVVRDCGRFYHRYATAGFYPILRAAVVAANLSLVGRVSGRSLKLFAKRGPSRPLRDGERLFAPLAFVPFEDSSLLRTADPILNREHAFCEWLVEAAPVLDSKYPGLLRQLRAQVFGEDVYYRYEPEYISPAINGVLQRLRELDLHIVPAGLTVRPTDFEVDA